MIIKGGAAGNVGWWGKHLQRDDTNERAEVKEISGLLATDLPTALREMQAIAAQSRSGGNFMYQANINPEAHERLTPEQWREAVDTLEKNLGLTGHQRVVVEHEKEGRTHRHIVWNRVDVDTLRVTDIGGNYYTHERTARQLERSFDHTPTPSPHGQQRPEGRADRAAELWEIRAAERSGIDRDQVKQDATEAWRTTDSGKAFAAAIEERGYILARGDRRDFCIVDSAGTAHSVARRIEGATTKDIRERLEDIDRDSLPSVADAREVMRDARRADRAAARDVIDKAKATQRDRRETANDIREAVGDVRGAAKDLTGAGLKVLDVSTGAVSLLTSFADSLLSGKRPEPTDNLDRIRAQRRALAAMEDIRESVERGENLTASDVAALPLTQLENIKAKGDDAIREMIEDLERARQRQNDYGRTRER